MFRVLKNQRGQITVIFVFIFIMLCGFVGFGIDVWLITYHKEQLQIGVDLAAVSAAQELPNGPVVSTAIRLARMNGIDSNELTVNHPYNGDDYEVELSATKIVDLSFLSSIGFDTKTISSRAVAKTEVQNETIINNQAFEYAIFSGSTTAELQIKGNNSTVYGNVHSNKRVSCFGKGHTINGNLESVESIGGSNRVTVTGTIEQPASILPIPKINFEELANQAVRVFNEDTTFSQIDIDGIIFVDGSCKINASKISGKGIIIVTGDVSISTNNLVYATANDLLAIYTLGNIQISSSSSTIQGVIYAPFGEIRISGSDNTFNGALIADSIVTTSEDIVVNAEYDIRAPQAFSVEKTTIRLVE